MHAAGQWTSLSWLVRRRQGRPAARVARSRSRCGSTVERREGQPHHRRRRRGGRARSSTRGTSERAAATCRRCSRSATAARRCRRRCKAPALAELLPERRRSSTASARRRPARRARQRVEAGDAPSDGVTRVHARRPTPPWCSTTTPAAGRARLRASSAGSRCAAASRSATTTTRRRRRATFVEVDGERWVLTGDMATVEEDGTIHLLGRGSQCINTGGEKVFPEEVEAVAQGPPRRSTTCSWSASPTSAGASGSPRSCSRSTGARLTPRRAASTHCRATLAGYKVPRTLVLVDQVERSPAGKADYRWAKRMADSV